jgi:hypothetical protein
MRMRVRVSESVVPSLSLVTLDQSYQLTPLLFYGLLLRQVQVQVQVVQPWLDLA